MARKTRFGSGECPLHGEYLKDAEDSPCPSCEDESELHEEYSYPYIEELQRMEECNRQ